MDTIWAFPFARLLSRPDRAILSPPGVHPGRGYNIPDKEGSSIFSAIKDRKLFDNRTLRRAC